MTRPSRVEPLVVLADRELPAPAGHLEHVLQAVARQLVGCEEQEVVGVAARDLAQPAPEHPGGLVRRASRRGRPSTAWSRQSGRSQVAQQHAAVGDRVRAHAPVALRARGRAAPAPAGRRRRTAPPAGTTRIHASSTRRCSSSVRAAGSGTWWARKVPSTGCPSTTGGHAPALRRAQDDHRPRTARHRSRGALAMASRHASTAVAICLVHVRRVVAGDDVRLVAVPAEQREQLLAPGSGPAASGWRSCTGSARGSAAPRRRAPGAGTWPRASWSPAGPVSASPSPTTQNATRSGWSSTAPNACSSEYPSSPPSWNEPGVSGAQWLGTPPGNEKRRIRVVMPRSSRLDVVVELGRRALEPRARVRARDRRARARRRTPRRGRGRRWRGWRGHT